ncbi:MAG: acylphosphatase [Thiotrichales bacterium SG8_50]|nr:MAG: acylphosphatase [Thiotrichales bacterium SG8_50]
MTRCVRCRVSGRVQGVFFRASTRQRAQALGLTGYARNMNNGDVEVLACGDAAAVSQLCDWLWEGPAQAVVRNVDCQLQALDAPPQSFTTR